MKHGHTISKPSDSSSAPLYKVRTISQVVPRPRSRSFVVGRTGSGKSTLCGALLEAYHALYPRHLVYILDYKERFVAVEPEREHGPLFPEGVRERSHGRRDGVSVVADYMPKPRRARDDDSCLIVQGQEAILAFCEWQFHHSTVKRPAMVYADETEDLMRGDHRAFLPFRRLVKMGREIGTGLVIINQEPVYVDRTWFTQSEQLYVGRLTQPEDREKLMKSAVVPGAWEHLALPLPFYTWLYFDQEHERIARFKLTETGDSISDS